MALTKTQETRFVTDAFHRIQAALDMLDALDVPGNVIVEFHRGADGVRKVHVRTEEVHTISA